MRYKQCYFGCPGEVNFQMRAPPDGEGVIGISLPSEYHCLFLLYLQETVADVSV
jgi:hypothetical protein